MRRAIHKLLAVLFLVLPLPWLVAEKPADLPIPTSYVNDYAHVLSPDGAEKIESLCLQVQQKADAQLFVVTIKTLDGGMSKEEFTDQLEEHWKAGKKGEDREAIVLYVLSPRGTRIETGYGLEGILNDAKVGAILDQADPMIKSGDDDGGLYAAVDGLANVIAADKGVTLNEPQVVHHYHYANQPAPRQGTSLGQILLGVGFVILIIILAKTGNLGWAIYLVMSLMGGGGGGGGRDDDDRGGGGFGGVGGGSSGGGGASRDF